MKQEGQFLLFFREEFLNWLLKVTIKRPVRLIQNHHTYSPDYHSFKGGDDGNHFKMLNNMKSFHVNERQMSDIAQNLSTFPDGLIALCRSLDTDPAGIKGANKGGICMEHIGNFDAGKDQMTDEQRRTIIFINAALCLKFNLTPNDDAIVYHHWYDLDTGKRTNGIGNVKTCPGTAFFGGNKVEDARENFFPLVTEVLVKLRK